MDNQRLNVIGNHNITGNHLNNVGNRTLNIVVSRPEGASGMLLTLESKVAFGALLNSVERYPAPHCHPDTRIAAKKVLKDWTRRRGFGSEKKIMWISGGPGVGKSAILQSVCEELTGDGESDFEEGEDDNSLIDACYFFGRGMGDREKAIFFPATIAHQLVLYRSSCGAAIRTILAKNPTILLESFISQFRKLVIRPAKALAESEAPVTVVIDALDECDNVRDQVTLLEAILDAATKANMRFVISSRPEEDIQAFFHRTNVSEHTYHVRLDDDFRVSRDIEIFLCDKFARIRERRPGLCPRLPNGEEWPGSVVIYQLRDDSDGQFIYPTLVIAFIDTSYPPPDQQLKSLLGASPLARHAFSKLDALYHHILSRCPPGVLAGSDELLEFQKLVKGILRAVVCWPIALSAAGIAEILDNEVDVVKAIIHGPMRSLFKFDSTDFDAVITLCHKSFRDYLFDRIRSQEFFLSDAESADGLVIEILSRQPPSDPSQLYSRETLMGVLAVVLVLGDCVDELEIANCLDVEPNLVKGVIAGPAKALFTLDGHKKVDFFSRSFKDFLLDANRAQEYVVSTKVLDALFIGILSRQPPSDPLRSYSQEVLMGVLRVLVGFGGWVKVTQIASLLDVEPSLVERVIFGPPKTLFEANDSENDVHLSLPSFKDFLMDCSRAGEYFIPKDKPLDPVFTQILSCQPPSDPLRSYSREVLMGVLRVLVAFGGWGKVTQIASLLDVVPSRVERVIFGPPKALFEVESLNSVHLSLSSLRDFLVDRSRAGEYFIPEDMPLDALFTRILSRQPPSDPLRSYSREVLMGVLTVVVALGSRLKLHEFATWLNVAPVLVDAVVFGPPKALFRVNDSSKVGLSNPFFKDFIVDPHRAGEYLISNDQINTLFIRILSRQPSDSLQRHSQEALMSVLMVFVVYPRGLTVPQVASSVDVDPAVVKGIVFGLPLFYVWPEGDVYLLSEVKKFLQDASRAGEFYIPPKDLNPNYASLYAKIKKIRNSS